MVQCQILKDRYKFPHCTLPSVMSAVRCYMTSSYRFQHFLNKLLFQLLTLNLSSRALLPSTAHAHRALFPEAHPRTCRVWQPWRDYKTAKVAVSLCLTTNRPRDASDTIIVSVAFSFLLSRCDDASVRGHVFNGHHFLQLWEVAQPS